MEIIMEQQPFKWKHNYKFIECNAAITAKANIGTFLTKRKIELYESEQIIIKAVENKTWQSYIPIVNWFSNEQFEVDFNGNVGEIENVSRWKQGKIFLTINGLQYVVYEHTGGFKGDAYSVYQDDKQIGLISKNVEVIWGAQTYKGLFHDGTNAIINGFLMVLIDVFWNEGEVSSHIGDRSREYSWGLDRKFGKPLDENWRVNERV